MCRCRPTAAESASVSRWPCQFWAACTTNISEREFPTGTNTSPHCVELFESIADLSLSEVPSACRAAFQVRTTISGVVTSWRIWSATARADLGSSRAS